MSKEEKIAQFKDVIESGALQISSADILRTISTIEDDIEETESFRCKKCGNEIDPAMCHCGDPINNHTLEHCPVPMGCECGRSNHISDAVPFILKR